MMNAYNCGSDWAGMWIYYRFCHWIYYRQIKRGGENMTLDEAIFCEKSYIGEANCTDCKYYGAYNTCQSRESHKMAIKALEQESVLDKIRAEIEKLDGRYVIGDYGIYGENIPKYVRFCDVVKIIDKCKAEMG